MVPITHVIDPDADTIITLRNASTNFAPWIKEEAPVYELEEKEEEIEGKEDEQEEGNEEAQEEGEEVIYFRVSSRHLMLASPWFKRLLKKEGWSESVRSEADGLLRINAADWDEDAFLILLNMFHLRHRQVPRTVTLETLAKIAVIVDYYECGEAIELFTDMWINALKTSTVVPSTYSRDLVLWIWVSWVFDMRDYFERATSVAIKQSEEASRTLDLPIPIRVTGELDNLHPVVLVRLSTKPDSIDCKRYQAIESIISQLHEFLEKYRNSNYQCPQDKSWSFQCGCFLLGALTKEMDRMELLSPRPEVPFAKLSFEGIWEKLKSTQSPAWSPELDCYDYHDCNLKNIVVEMVTAANVEFTGLDLKETKGVEPSLHV
jgi:hypothetical protein